MKSDMTGQETNEGITALEERQQTGSLPVSENDSIVVYEEKREKRKSIFRKWKKLSRKKRKRIIGGSVLLILILAGTLTVVVLAKKKNSAAATMTVQMATAESGNISSTVVGTGSLASAGTVDVIVPTGIKVDTVSVASGDSVTAGQTIATLNQASIASEMISVQESIDSIDEQLSDSTLSALEIEELNGERTDLAEALSTLTALHDNPVITATTNGIIGTVSIANDTEITKSSGTSSGASTGSTSSGSQTSSADVETVKVSAKQAMAQLLNLSSTTGTTASAGADTSREAEETAVYSTQTGTEDGDDTKGSVETEGEDDAVTAVDLPISIQKFEKLKITAPKKDAKPQTQITETDEYMGEITWDCTNERYSAGTVYTATILLTAKDGYAFDKAYLPVIDNSTYNWDFVSGDSGENGNILRIVATFERTESEKADSSGSGNSGDSGSGSDTQSGSGSDGTMSNTQSGSGSNGTASNSQSETANGNTASGSDENTQSATGSGSSGTVSSGSSSGSTNSGSSDSSTTTSAELYSSYETAACTIQSQDNVVISVNVDELDILSVKTGQTAAITLDALDDQTFTGTITSVAETASSSSSSSSGSAKYVVKITLPKDENMKIGMTASATINIAESDNAVLIPISALQEKGNATFVYTKKDDDGSLSGEVEVETGLSNSSQVEIVSGLSEGDTVYYLKTESTDSSSDMGGMMGGEMPGGGDMGGDMGGGQSGERPDGGGQGGGQAPGQ